MTMRTIRCITTFDAIVDTDFGLVRLVLDEFNNPEFLKKGADKIKYNLTGVRALLADRKLENPLSTVLVSKIADQYDSLRDQFMEAYYEQILTLSGDTSITRILATASKTQSLVETTVLCKSQLEIDHLAKCKFPGKFVLFNGDPLASDPYDEFYLKRLSDLALFEPLRNKSVFALEYNFNILKKDPIFGNHEIEDKYLELLGINNTSTLYDPSMNQLYTIPVYPDKIKIREEETTNGNK